MRKTKRPLANSDSFDDGMMFDEDRLRGVFPFGVCRMPALNKIPDTLCRD